MYQLTTAPSFPSSSRPRFGHRRAPSLDLSRCCGRSFHAMLQRWSTQANTFRCWESYSSGSCRAKQTMVGGSNSCRVSCCMFLCEWIMSLVSCNGGLNKGDTRSLPIEIPLSHISTKSSRRFSLECNRTRLISMYTTLCIFCYTCSPSTSVISLRIILSKPSKRSNQGTYDNFYYLLLADAMGLTCVRLWSQIVTNFVIPQTGQLAVKDRKVAAVGLTRLLTQSTQSLNEPNVKTW